MNFEVNQTLLPDAIDHLLKYRSIRISVIKLLFSRKLIALPSVKMNNNSSVIVTIININLLRLIHQ